MKKIKLINVHSHWVMAHTWQNVLFAHWPVDPAVVQATLPKGIEVDTLDGQAWISVVPFQLSYKPRGLDWLPKPARFTELNLRTYVRMGNQTGVYFYTLEATDWFAVKAAQTLFNLAYRYAPLLDLRQRKGTFTFLGTRQNKPGKGKPGKNKSGQSLSKKNNPAHIKPGLMHVELIFKPGDPLTKLTKLDQFLTERYRLFTTNARGKWFTTRIWHEPWQLQTADVTMVANTLPSLFGFEGVDPKQPVLTHYAKQLAVKTGISCRCS